MDLKITKMVQSNIYIYIVSTDNSHPLENVKCLFQKTSTRGIVFKELLKLSNLALKSKISYIMGQTGSKGHENGLK